ncbi:MAG: transcriptional regulator [Nitrospirae bacterium RBG_19FT_COMBO_55_12]|nr:MAG: transcriptional regulator [Nitrospirae bacterium RBG_19FT_COMBO_55_12]
MCTISHIERPRVKETLKFARKRGIFTAGEAAREGIHSQILTRLVRQGAVERIARGQYRYPEQAVTEHHSLAVIARAVPHGVICLISALSFHEIGTQLPPHVWLAIDRHARRPKVRYHTLRIVKLSGKAFTEGIETHHIEGQPVKIYGVAKTLADLFKYRNKIGLDVALEALREAWRERRFTMDEMDRYARICRVQRVMKPYLEALVA